MSSISKFLKLKLLFLFALTLVPNLLLGCQNQTDNLSQNQTSIYAQNLGTTKLSPEVSESLSKLNQGYENFQKSLTSFLAELAEVVQQKRNANTVVLKITYEQLNSITKTQEELQAKITTIEPELSSQITPIANDIEATIQELIQVIEPLQAGLSKQNVRQIQEFLNFFERRNVSPQYYGIYGPTTQEEVYIFINQKSTQLKKQINQLNTLLTNQTLTDNNTSSLGSDPNFQALVKQVELLSKDNQQLKISLNNTRNLYLLINFLIITSLVSIIVLSLTNKKTKKRNPVSIQRTYNLTTNDLQVIEDDLYEKISKKLQNNYSQSNANTAITHQNDEELNTPQSSSIKFDWQLHKSQLDENIGNIQPQLSFPKVQQNQATLFSPDEELVEVYKEKPDSLASDAIMVSEVQTNLSYGDLEQRNLILLEQNAQGNYWLIKAGEFEYIVPRPNLNITELNYQSLRTLFVCYGYQSGMNNSKFELLKPARVSPSYEGDTWELVQPGIIEFASVNQNKQLQL